MVFECPHCSEEIDIESLTSERENGENRCPSCLKPFRVRDAMGFFLQLAEVVSAVTGDLSAVSKHLKLETDEHGQLKPRVHFKCEVCGFATKKPKKDLLGNYHCPNCDCIVRHDV